MKPRTTISRCATCSGYGKIPPVFNSVLVRTYEKWDMTLRETVTVKEYKEVYIPEKTCFSCNGTGEIYRVYFPCVVKSRSEFPDATQTFDLRK